MKKREAYPFTSNRSKNRYEFTSTGPKGEILKIVEFADLKFAHNLAFGDEDHFGDFDDSTITDNGDMREVLQTIANIVHQFLETHPGRKIYIEPVDRKRKLLYNRIFQQKHEEIIEHFSIQGVTVSNRKLWEYKPNIMYDAFLIEVKKR